MEKRFLIIMMLVVMLLNFGTGSIYSSQEDPVVLLEDISFEESITAEFREENARIYNAGLKTFRSSNDFEFEPQSTVDEYIMLNVPKYFQNGQTWSSHIMKTKNLSIGTHGCALTSFAMVTNYYGSQHNPGQVNSTLGNNACDLQWGNAAPLYGLEFTREATTSESYAKTYIRGALRNNRPVIICFENGPTTHFVVARGYLREAYDPDNGFYGKEYYYIHDPASNRDWKQIDTYLDNGWNFVSLRPFWK